MNNIGLEIAIDNNFNIVNILLIDHSYIKECIQVLSDAKADKNKKLFYARTFLDTLKKHYHAEEKTVYDSLGEMEELRKYILEGLVEHSLAKFKFEMLINRLNKMKQLDEMTEIELKVLADVIHRHIIVEEELLFPKMFEILDREILNEIGFQFMILRKFTHQDLKNYPELQSQIYHETLPLSSRQNMYQWSGKFVKKVNRYIASILANPHLPIK